MKKLYPLLSVLFLIYWGCGHFDEESYVGVTFGGNGNDEGYSVQQTTDGGYIITGVYNHEEDNDDSDIWLIKTDSNGNKEWKRRFGDGDYDKGYGVQQTTDGGYIMIGNYNLLVKTDSEGNEEWIKNIGGRSVQQTTDGGYIIGQSSGGLLKTDSDGNEEWWNQSIDLYGGYSVQQTTDGGYIMTGNYNLVKTDSQGNVEWNRTIDGCGLCSPSVRQTTDGGYICVFGNDLVKTNSQGNVEWNRTFSSNDIGRIPPSRFNSVQQTTDGGYIITGEFYIDRHDVGLIKTDSNGNKVWIKSFNSFCTRSYNDRYCQDDGGNSVQQTTDGGYIITGFIRNTLNSSNTDIWLIKTDSKGNSEWNDRQ